MTKAPINLQDLRRRIYRKAKSDKSHRFWGLFVHVTKMETLEEAYRVAKSNGGAPGVDGQTFADIEQAGRTAFLKAIQEDLITGRYKPTANRRVDIPKGNGKVRTLQIPCIRDRVVQLAPLGVELNPEKTRVVDTLKGEAFGFLGFDLRRVRKSEGSGYFLQMTPKKKARKAIKARVRDIIQRSGTTPMPMVVAQINAAIAGWVNYFRVGNASRAFSEVRQYMEMKVRTLLTRRKRRRKTSIGWQRWSNEYLYDVLGLYWGWKVQPLPGAERVS